MQIPFKKQRRLPCSSGCSISRASFVLGGATIDFYEIYDCIMRSLESKDPWSAMLLPKQMPHHKPGLLQARSLSATLQYWDGLVPEHGYSLKPQPSEPVQKRAKARVCLHFIGTYCKLSVRQICPERATPPSSKAPARPS